MKVAVTGATGYLGQTMVSWLARRNVDVFLVGHRIADYMRADVVFHLAAPDHRNEQECVEFTYFNEDLATWASNHSVPVINTATWWQHAGVDAESLIYTRTKCGQQSMFADQTTLTLFSVYGATARSTHGFVPQLITHLRGQQSLAAASIEARDWIHVEDICRAFWTAIEAPVGVYDVATYLQISPMDLARVFTDEVLMVYPDKPSAVCTYTGQRLPGWRARIAVTQYIAEALEEQTWQSPTGIAR